MFDMASKVLTGEPYMSETCHGENELEAYNFELLVATPLRR